MTSAPLSSHIAFDGYRRLAAGPLSTVAIAVKRAVENDAVGGTVLIFDNATGRSIDIDTRGSDDDIAARYAQAESADDTDARRDGAARESASGAPGTPDANGGTSEPRGRGRPKLGVVAREVTLLPRHWEWLATQPGGASVVLRRLVDEARRTHAHQDRNRRTQERAYHFMSAIAGDMPGFEEATRALFANDGARLRERVAAWPADVRDHAIALAFANDDATPPPAAR
ncbi:DUF2239 family protein [Burkholderia oklahomensis]|uniref:DUF2239 domain-containing protein n=1 Tax=Burkholderia oklahomensis TaxID=342113 RepID=A0AAI8B3M1_9BURK|nr:DUF2239 family protein [Burkholderia oklahomensis]AIO64899.1 hypothetical protein DM82_751 [Burkholderia oklahomensis]AOI44232.1 hypothetical protein WG70_25540 [Burkholderia oklahomensis EO147]KUY58623.1 hypothetical protein WG70_07550 [Burkholderia oklahomensis EO147]QPS39057.1 DUF2239 family protein [Burkholderia oklahomensis]